MENLTLEIENYILKRQIKAKDKKIFTLEVEKEFIRQQLETAQKLINSYYDKGKHDVNKYIIERKELSEGAKQFVRDIVEGKYNEDI